MNSHLLLLPSNPLLPNPDPLPLLRLASVRPPQWAHPGPAALPSIRMGGRAPHLPRAASPSGRKRMQAKKSKQLTSKPASSGEAPWGLRDPQARELKAAVSELEKPGARRPAKLPPLLAHPPTGAG
ncbi:uncharacterized protein A4U43_C09F4110 [Asparagus officinalis]|uniref:Uncharacterized protein n=1 Tax=Asparagus officinalis TaxID=4686 RepID=A0A5P1E5Q0_ASPOF|nr:uncharacterized protein A4U43_C09F4110 [Asparagus officinalis]